MKGGKLNILIAIDSFYDGGAEMFAIRLANELVTECKVSFLELNPDYSEEKRQLSHLDINKIDLIQTGKTRLESVIWKLRKLWMTEKKINYLYNRQKGKRIERILKKRNTDIVHSHSWVTDVFFSKYVNGNYRHITTFHGEYEAILKNIRTTEVIEQTQAALNRISAVVYLTKQHLLTLIRFGFQEKKRFKIFNGLNYKIANDITVYAPDRPLKILMTGRGIKEKGWMEAIKAVEILTAKGWAVELSLLGEGEFLESLKSEYGELQNIKFNGFHYNVRPDIEAVHIGLLPSFYIPESLPNSIIEFLFCGKPVIATCIGAIDEMLCHQGKMGGTLINIFNQRVRPEDIATAIEEYLQNPTVVAEHSAIALKAARKFEMSKCVQAYISLFHNVSNSASN